MKKVLCFMLALLMVMSLTGCGEKNKSDANVEEALSGMVDAASSKMDKKSEDDTKTEENSDITAPEQDAEVEEEIVDNRTPVQKFWGGDWYGIMWITNANGNYESFKNTYWDAMGIFDVDAEGNADSVLWYKGMSRDNPVAEVKFSISEDSGSGEMGAAVSESGWMFVNSDTGNGDIEHADWIVDPMTDKYSTKYGNGLIHIEGEFIDGSGGLYYHFFLRKWGALWDDVAGDTDIFAPGFYEDWYKPLIEEGYAMPDNIGDPGKEKMSDGASSGSKSSDDKGDSQGAVPEKKYTGGDFVLADDEYCKIVIKGMGTYAYNDSWYGYQVELTNKADYSMGFYSYAEPDSNEQTWDSIGTGNTCYYMGVICDTHFENVINPGKTMDDACLVIDGVTDVSQLGSVEGYIVITNNETGEVLNNIPYSL